jgi:hypothetical protein
MGPRLALGAAVALSAGLLWTFPSGAFHNSALDPQSKQALAELLEELQDECRAGNREACVQVRQVQAFGNQLAQAQQACAKGDQRACRVAAQAQQQLAALLEQAGAAEEDSPSPMPSEPTFQSPQRGQESSAPIIRPDPQDDRRNPLPGRGAPEQGTAVEAGDRPKRSPAEAGRPGASADQAPASMGLLQSSLFVGKDGPWQAYTKGATYVLENRSDPTALKYFYLLDKSKETGRRIISVKVQVESEDKESPLTGAGLLYAYAAEKHTKQYYGYFLESDRSMSLYERGPEGLERVLQSHPAKAVKDHGLNELRIVEQGQSIKLYLNGSELGFELGNEAMGKGGVGILVAGVGRFTFTDFTYKVD